MKVAKVLIPQEDCRLETDMFMITVAINNPRKFMFLFRKYFLTYITRNGTLGYSCCYTPFGADTIRMFYFLID